MTDFQSEFDNTTDTINSIVSTQLPSVFSWNPVPGTLTKASSSPAGYVWGFNSVNKVYSCQLPCSGQWSNVDLSTYGVSTIHDLTTDLTNVYILADTTLLVGPITGQGNWTTLEVPFAATQVFSTQTYIWAQDTSGNKQRCAKPCVMANWQKSGDTTVLITSASNSGLYGKDKTGKAVQSDETLQTGWSPISGFLKLAVSEVIGQQDSIYAVDTNSKLFHLTDSTPEPVDTQGYSPLNLTIDPSTQDLWMTTADTGQIGNIFTRVEKPTYTNVMNSVNPLDIKRNKIASEIETQYAQQTSVMTVEKQMNDVVTFVKNLFSMTGKTEKEAQKQSGHLKEQIENTQTQLDSMTKQQTMLQNIVILFAIVAVVYLIGSFLGNIIHGIAFAVLIGGMYYIVKNNNG